MKQRGGFKATYVPPASSGAQGSSSSDPKPGARSPAPAGPRVSYTKAGRRVIKFHGEHACFSNFSPHPILLNDKLWPTTEHYFQAQKFVGTELEEKIRTADAPVKAKRLARRLRSTRRSDWEQVKDDFMYECVKAKFTQHDDIRRTLLDTADALIVEHTAHDRYWGDGGDGSGMNMLGKILMRVRDELNEQQHHQ